MSELWRDTLERLSAELEKINEAGNCRQGQNVPRRHAPQRQILLPPPPRAVTGQRSHLALILDAIPEPHQEYLPATRQEYPPSRQNAYTGRTYAYQALQIGVLSGRREWRPRPIQAGEVSNAREASKWRNFVAASFFGAVMGIGSYALLLQRGAWNGPPVEALTAIGTPKAADQQSAASDRALFAPPANQRPQDEALPPRAAYATMAQSEIPQRTFSGSEAFDHAIFAFYTAHQSTPGPGVAGKGEEKAKPAKLSRPEAAKPHKKPANAISSGSGILRR